MNLITFFKLLAVAFVGLFPHKDFDITQVPTDNPSPEVVAQLQHFENSFVYPFSEQEEFTIQHGLRGDYFAFFKQLGKPYCYMATAKQEKTVTKMVQGQEVAMQQTTGEIAAVVCCVLRALKDKDNQPLQAWYMCDLKVNEKYQGEHLPTTIANKKGFARFIQCPRGFAICMNPANGDPRAASIFKKHGTVTGLKTETLNLYNLSYEQALKNKHLLEESYRRSGYLRENASIGIVSTSGNKGYVIKNKLTGKTYPWKLLHIKPGIATYDPQEGATHMICAVEGTALDSDFKELVGQPSSTAQIVSYGMDNVDFNCLTSDQI